MTGFEQGRICAYCKRPIADDGLQQNICGGCKSLLKKYKKIMILHPFAVDEESLNKEVSKNVHQEVVAVEEESIVKIDGCEEDALRLMEKIFSQIDNQNEQDEFVDKYEKVVEEYRKTIKKQEETIKQQKNRIWRLKVELEGIKRTIHSKDEIISQFLKDDLNERNSLAKENKKLKKIIVALVILMIVVVGVSLLVCCFGNYFCS